MEMSDAEARRTYGLAHTACVSGSCLHSLMPPAATNFAADLKTSLGRRGGRAWLTERLTLTRELAAAEPCLKWSQVRICDAAALHSVTETKWSWPSWQGGKICCRKRNRRREWTTICNQSISLWWHLHVIKIKLFFILCLMIWNTKWKLIPANSKRVYKHWFFLSNRRFLCFVEKKC